VWTFLALTDSGVLVAGREKSFAASAGIDLELVRTESWATQRHRLIYAQLHAAHMLAPPLAARDAGLSQRPALSAPFKLDVNGNAVVMALDLAAALVSDIAAGLDRALGTASPAACHSSARAAGAARRWSSTGRRLPVPPAHLPSI